MKTVIRYPITTVSALKNIAKNLKRLDGFASLSEAQEALARHLGYADWHHVSATIGAGTEITAPGGANSEPLAPGSVQSSAARNPAFAAAEQALAAHEAWKRSRGFTEEEILEGRHEEYVFHLAKPILAERGLELGRDSNAGSWTLTSERFPLGFVAYASPFFDGGEGIEFALEDVHSAPLDAPYYSTKNEPYQYTTDPEADARVYVSKVLAYFENILKEHAERFSLGLKFDEYMKELFIAVSQKAKEQGFIYSEGSYHGEWVAYFPDVRGQPEISVLPGEPRYEEVSFKVKTLFGGQAPYENQHRSRLAFSLTFDTAADAAQLIAQTNQFIEEYKERKSERV